MLLPPAPSTRCCSIEPPAWRCSRLERRTCPCTSDAEAQRGIGQEQAHTIKEADQTPPVRSARHGFALPRVQECGCRVDARSSATPRLGFAQQAGVSPQSALVRACPRRQRWRRRGRGHGCTAHFGLPLRSGAAQQCAFASRCSRSRPARDEEPYLMMGHRTGGTTFPGRMRLRRPSTQR